MKRLLCVLLLCLMLPAALAETSEAPGTASDEVTVLDPDDAAMGRLLTDLLIAYEQPGEVDLPRIDADVAAIADEADRAVAASVAEHWKKVYLDPDYRLLILGTDDPALLEIPDPAAHAFAVLGYALQDGEMTDELKGRCDAAAAAARAFPGSILVCTGGATGPNNPEKHTEAGLMKDYLVNVCGIEAERIFTDERAMTTAENAVNTFAILREQDIRTMTIVTSSYHQRWGQVLYNALAAQYLQRYGYSAVIVGNYCYDIEPETAAYRQGQRIAVRQLAQILGLPREALSGLPAMR